GNLTGSGLDNTLFAGNGTNVLDGQGGVDTACYLYATAWVSVSLATTAAQATGGSGTDTVRNIENLTGSAFNDTLTGSAGGNVIDGGSGNDTITGGGGADFLTGGAGADTFVYLAATDSLWMPGRDAILDFTTGLDKLSLVGIDANDGVVGDQAFSSTFISSGDFTAVGQLKWEGGVLYGNTDSDFGDAEFVLQITGSVVAADVLL
ncbi:MAG TPA: M10 family metallopeptidase C-terminal domain-containing protein, partial [Ramlibacter sp.]|nr:M10 family metallopeptidase C-terminal domain-containing protein [Ramlibacter sp.]